MRVPAGAAAPDGTINCELLLASEIFKPPPGAGVPRVPMQMVFDSGPITLGVHEIVDNSGATESRLIVALSETPLSPAVMVAA
jgi:hypothetical protein